MEARVLKILNDNFGVPLDSEGSMDLRQYLSDSIDAGELVVIINQKFGLELELASLRDIHTIKQLLNLIARRKNES